MLKKIELTVPMLSPSVHKRIGHFRFEFDNSPNMKRSFAVKEFCLFEFSISGIIYGLICQAAESYQAAGTLAQGKNL